MKVLFFGGSFNPIHHGHLICARAAAEAGGFDRVILMPSAQSPHKPYQTDLASPQQRLEMCRLAVAGSGLFEVGDLELRRNGPSYTIDTVRELKAKGHEKVHWLIGADMLVLLPKWHRAEELVAEVEFVVMARPGWEIDWAALPEVFRGLRQRVVPAPLIDISATDIRRRVKAGRAIEFLTPAGVCEYIRREGIWK